MELAEEAQQTISKYSIITCKQDEKAVNELLQKNSAT
jgi:hypothetical protein